MASNPDLIAALLAAAQPNDSTWNDLVQSLPNLQVFVSVQGDVIQVGSITDSNHIAIGSGAQANTPHSSTAAPSGSENTNILAIAPLTRIYTSQPESRAADQLAGCLELRGLEVAQSAIDQRMSTAGLQHEFQHASALVLVLGQPETSDVLRTVFLPALRYASEQRPWLPVYVMLDHVQEQELSFRPQEFATRELRRLATQEQALNALAYAIFVACFAPTLTKHMPLVLGLSAHREAGAPAGHLRLDMRPWFERGVPNAQEWSRWLTPALLDTKRLCDLAAIYDITLCSHARLSAGLMAGYMYRESAHKTLRIEQPQRGQAPAVWCVDAEASTEPVLHIARTQLADATDDYDLTIEISSPKQPVASHVERWLVTHPGHMTERITFDLLPDRLDEGQTVAAAQQIARELLALRRRKAPPQSLHLFSSASLSLMAMLGWHLNTTLPIQTYELSSDNRDYEASVLVL